MAVGPYSPTLPEIDILAPFMEGWYENEDGTYTISFGYSNANLDTLYIPVGEDNFLDPAQFDGVQSTIFFPGHHRGIFTVHSAGGDEGHRTSGGPLRKANGDVTRVPGRTTCRCLRIGLEAPASRQVSLPAFPSTRSPAWAGDLRASWQNVRRPSSVGSPLTLSVNPTDPSERDPDDARSSGGHSPSRGVVPAPGSRTGRVHAARVQPAP